MKTHIVCYGNQWHEGDQVGHLVYEKLNQLTLPPSVSVFDAGISGLNSILLFEGCERVLVVDAIPAMEAMGRVHKLKPEDIELPETPPSSHNIGVGLLLYMLPRVMDSSEVPEIVIYGIESSGDNYLSDQDKRAIDEGIEKLVVRIQKEL